MQNFIIGTAGHIDHGKTTLIKALTGRDTDTLKEEKQRGISVNLGFTYFDLPSGKQAGIIDVPGHERFIKNMLAGAGGIDLVLLTVAANEGVKPQTLEHIDILSFLNIQHSIIVMTKCSLADAEFKALVRDDIQEQVKGTFFEEAEIVEVDSVDRSGLDVLIRKIDQFAAKASQRNENAPPRMPVDRVFTVKGFGTVVTGTLTEGSLKLDDELMVYPKMLPTKVRNLQVHEKNTEIAYAGQRTAINLANIKTSEIERGDMLAPPSALQNSTRLDVKLKLLNRTKTELRMWSRIRLYIGTKEVMARVVPMGKEVIIPGSEAFAQLRLEEELAVKKGDRFVVRLYSPMETVGGGIVLDATPKKHGRRDQKILDSLAVKEQGDIKDLIEELIRKHDTDLVAQKDIVAYAGVPEEETVGYIEELLADNQIYLLDQSYLHQDYYFLWQAKASKILSDYHQKFPLRTGVPKEELRTKLKSDGKLPFKPKEYDAFLKLMAQEGIVRLTGNMIADAGFVVQYTPSQKAEKDRIEKVLLEAGYIPPTIDELTMRNKESSMVLESLIGDTAVKLDDTIVIHKKYFDEALQLLTDFIRQNGEITLAQFRDMIQSTRKYAMALLEYFDNNKITLRKENARVLY